MALTQLADVIIPEVYQTYSAIANPELTAFFDAGVAVRSEGLNAAIATGGRIVHLPFWKDIDPTVEPNYSTDNPADVGVPDKVVAAEMLARTADMNKGMSAADLAAELAGSNPMQHIRNRFATYWARQFQRRVLAVCKGLMAENIATDSGDMVVNLALETTVGVTAENLFSRQALTHALFTLGDHFGEIQAMAVHSIVFKRMVDNDDIEFIRPAESDPNLPLSTNGIPYYLGKRVIVDDSMPVVAGTTSGFKYTSILFGGGAIALAERSALNPVEVYRRPDQGNGGGIEQLWERKCWVIHPFGFKFNSATITGGFSPSNADMALAANWTRVIDRKLVPICFLVTNG